MSRLSPRSGAFWCLTASAALVAAACSSTDVPIGEADHAHAGDGGGAASAAGASAAGTLASIDAAGSTMASGNASTTGAQAGTGSSGASAGGNAASAGGAGGALAGAAGSGDAGAAPMTCSGTFGAALVKDCTSAADCVLANHNDCCGNVVTAIKMGTTTSFDAADQSYQACTPGCGSRGCFHADMAEDGKQLGSIGDAFAAVCQSSRCSSTVVPGTSQCSVDADCAPGLVCVAFVTNVGPTTSTKRECHANPCNNVTASCGCGSGICTSAGFPLCKMSGTELVCDDGLK